MCISVQLQDRATCNYDHWKNTGLCVMPDTDQEIVNEFTRQLVQRLTRVLKITKAYFVLHDYRVLLLIINFWCVPIISYTILSVMYMLGLHIITGM